jgi:hypothetical protein
MGLTPILSCFQWTLVGICAPIVQKVASDARGAVTAGKTVIDRMVSHRGSKPKQGRS